MTNKTRNTNSLYQRLYPKISARITAPFLLSIIIIAGIGIFIVTRLVAGSIQERLQNQLVDSAQAAANAVSEIETQQLATLRLFTFTEGVAEALADDDVSELDALLRPIAANSRVDELIVFDITGRTLLHLSQQADIAGIQYDATQPVNVQNWPGVTAVLSASGDALGDKFIDLNENFPEPALYISAPVTDSAQGTLVGGISIGIKLANLTARVAQQSLSEVSILNSTGAVLGTTFINTPAERLGLSSEEAQLIFHSVHAGDNPTEERDLEDQPYQFLYSALTVRSQPVAITAVALPTHFIAERISISRDLFIVLFASMMVVVMIMGLLITRSIVRPIRRMVATTRAIREGDLTRRVGLYRPDELGELGISFDQMTSQLIQRNEKINSLYTAQLEETARREAVLASISDPVLVVDPTGKVILLNNAAKSMIKSSEQRPNEYQHLVSLCKTPQALLEPIKVSLSDRHYNVRATSVNMPDGHLLGHVIVFHDITSLVEIERVKDEMVLQLSHELRTPLTAARGYVELVKLTGQQELSEQSNGFVDNAVTHLFTLERMIDQVIDVSEIVANKFSLDIEPCNVGDILTKVIEQEKPRIARQNLKLGITFTQPLDLPVEADPHRLSEVFEHILRNAYSYTLAGGWIKIGAYSHNGNTIVSFADNGVGIAQDEIEKVFERLYRGRSAEAGPTDSRGLGLGLYVSQQIIEAHQGTIVLESTPDVGTTVTIRIPSKQRD